MDPDTTAGAMLSVLDRVPSYRESFERRGTSREAMVETIAVILHGALTGPTLDPARPGLAPGAPGPGGGVASPSPATRNLHQNEVGWGYQPR